ncbi:hypothetical protein L6164_032514 [Bauhinia variegata]|uniref:Uncharacterized protein n=1 Tax=Bauhinia variegata TaxID=167791 RepID=A0ACB9KP28_BAUVA|nr:hypothetical protein L6164_032514 [Bauhinia variegata]
MADASDPFPMLGSVYRGPGSKVNQLSQNVGNIKLKSEQTGSASRPWFPQNSSSNAWGHSNVIQKLSKLEDGESVVANGNNWHAKCTSPKNLTCSGKEDLKKNLFPPKSASPTPENETHTSVTVDTTPYNGCNNGQFKGELIRGPPATVDYETNDDESVDSESDDIVFDSDDNVSLDDADSDSGQKSHEKRKESNWFSAFFGALDKLTIEEANSQERQWHCPACQGGTGAIDWYRGLQSLVDHARTIKARRARLHRLFVKILEEEFRRKRASITADSEAYGIWEGLDKKVKDHEIVWPPMVVITNTKFQQDENSKWIGMGNQELLDCFSSYAALKARHSYGPQGHRGISVLIFESSAAGYLEAVRLHKHFKEQKRDREAWNHCQSPYLPGGKRLLYGYLASREDLDTFNRHSGNSKLKFEMKSYQEMVESKIKHINEDSQQLNYFKHKAANTRVLAKSLSKVSERLRKTTEENHLVRERTRMLYEQNKEEMDAQETFFQDQIQRIRTALEAKEGEFGKLLQEKRSKLEEPFGSSSGKEEDKHSFMKLQVEEMRQFEAERDKVDKIHRDQMLALWKKYLQDKVELENEYKDQVTQLMDKFTSLQNPEESD